LIAYADTSFLASLYGRDANSQQAVEEYRATGAVFLLSPFGEFELINAFESRIFRREADPAEIAAYKRAIEADAAARLFIREPMPAAACERAILLSRRHARRLGTRAMDILHVAIAIELGAQVFFTFDRGQRRLARAAGLTLRPRR
jgi:predicted nucleic acid-binding protein